MLKNAPIWTLLAATFISWAAWGLVINKISPVESPRIALPAFYASSFFSLLTTFTVVGSFLRKFSSPGKKMLNCINVSLRQGVILAAVCIIALLFQQMHIFTWWIGVLLITIGIILETLFWESKEQK